MLPQGLAKMYGVILEINHHSPRKGHTAASILALWLPPLAAQLGSDPVETPNTVGIEPTDSNFSDLHPTVEGSVHNTIGKPPPLQVMVFDWGQTGRRLVVQDSPWLALPSCYVLVAALELLLGEIG